jgi:adenosylhomocysteinase
VNEGSRLDRQVRRLTPALDREIASLELRAMGVGFDQLTSDQERYLASWDLGT